MIYKTSLEQRKKALEYYYNNKAKVSKYQINRWTKKYQEDDEFRKKRQLRDKTRMLSDGSMTNLKNEKCSICKSNLDLHRHHPSYKKLDYIVVCRPCHNKIHFQT